MSKRIYVGNLSLQTTEQNLFALFTHIGQVESVTIITDRDTDQSKGWIKRMMPILIYPIVGTLAVGLIMLLVVGRPVASANAHLTSWLNGLSGTNEVLLGLLLGAMMAFDMGGPRAAQSQILQKSRHPTCRRGLKKTHPTSAQTAVALAGMARG